MTQEFEVLLIEDNASDAEMITRALKKNNLATRILQVKDGNEALVFLFGQEKYMGRQTKDVPKVIIIDLKMPKVNGKECLMRIKADNRTRKIPVVVFSSSREDSDIDECYDLGASGYVVKPVASDEFEKAVVDLGSYWLSTNETPH
jgi:two-component system, response regulator